jgi:hypothetical protein
MYPVAQSFAAKRCVKCLAEAVFASDHGLVFFTDLIDADTGASPAILLTGYCVND